VIASGPEPAAADVYGVWREREWPVAVTAEETRLVHKAVGI
jgi:hypothetical protein